MKNEKKNFKNSYYFFSNILITQLCTYSFFLNFLSENQNFNNFGYYYLNFTYIFLTFTLFEFGTNFFSLKNILISKKLDFFYIFLNLRQYLFVFSFLTIISLLILDIKLFRNFEYLLIFFFSVSFLCHPYQIFLRYKNNFKSLFYSSIIQLIIILILNFYLFYDQSLNLISSLTVLIISICVKFFFLRSICRKRYKLSFFKFKKIKLLFSFFSKSFKYFIFFFLINFILRVDLVILDYLNFSDSELSIMSLYIFIFAFILLPYMSYLNVSLNSFVVTQNPNIFYKNKKELIKIYMTYLLFGTLIVIMGFLADKFLYLTNNYFIIFIGLNIFIYLMLLIILYLLFFFIAKSNYIKCLIILFLIFYFKFLFLNNIFLDNFYFLITISNLVVFSLTLIITLIFYNSIKTSKKI